MKSFIFRDSYTWLVAFLIPLAFIALMFLAPSLYYGDYVYHVLPANQKPEKFDVSKINLAVFLWIFSFVIVFIFCTVALFNYRNKKTQIPKEININPNQ